MKGINGAVNYKRTLTTTKIKDIFTSPEKGAISLAFTDITRTIDCANKTFMLDISNILDMSKTNNL